MYGVCTQKEGVQILLVGVGPTVGERGSTEVLGGLTNGRRDKKTGMWGKRYTVNPISKISYWVYYRKGRIVLEVTVSPSVGSLFHLIKWSFYIFKIYSYLDYSVPVLYVSFLTVLTKLLRCEYLPLKKVLEESLTI